MTFEKWAEHVSEDIKNDAVWKVKAYRIALYLSDLCWDDSQKIIDKRFFSLADQLYRSAGSVSANIIEGYSRNSLNEKARFYEIALGSARESKDWYFKSRNILGKEVVDQRFKVLTSIIKLLLTMVNDKRNKS